MGSTPFNLILGLAGPYGAGCSSTADELYRALKDWPGCWVEKIHVASLFQKFYPLILNKSLEVSGDSRSDRRKTFQKAGTDLRQYDLELIGHSIVAEIYKRGLTLEEENKLEGIGTVIFIIDSLKNINDFSVLNKIYSDEFYFIFVHANKEIRWHRLKDYESWLDKEKIDFEECDAVDSDEKDYDPDVGDAGQQVRKLASVADYYIVNNQNREKLREDAKRFLRLIFGNGNQPTIHERAMHLAFSASNRSFCLSRQVGAAVFDTDGNVIGVGHNDCPKANGGLYTQEDGDNDKRCYLVGERRCINDINKQERFNELQNSICKELKIMDNDTRCQLIGSIISKSPFREATEFCRAVHAEMEALLSIARVPSRSSRGAIMYVTTQPCHNCTKHILCAGISKVFYIEPYPKSLAEELHSDAIVFDPLYEDDCIQKLLFVPYQGVAPLRYHDFFLMRESRKDEKGMILQRTKEDRANIPKFTGQLV